MTPLRLPATAGRAVSTATQTVAVVRAHPRHLVLFALVAGLLSGPHAPWLAIGPALTGALLAGWRPLALAAAIAALAGAVIADARVAALGPGVLADAIHRPISADVVLLEPLRPRADGSLAARVRVAGAAADPAPAGSAGASEPASRAAPDLDAAGAGADLAARARGEQVVVRALDGRAPGAAIVGDVLHVEGRIVPLRRSDRYQRRRGAHAALIASAWSRTSAHRAGLAGDLDAARERAAHALGRGLDPPRAALLRGMVLGQDEAIDEDTRTAFERSGLAHLLAVSGQNVLLLSTLVLAIGAGLGAPLRARLLLAMAVVALYVPLAGAGPSIQRAGVMGVAGLVAALAGRPASRWYALGLAAAVTLALNPAAAAEPGWQLSFVAVVGLLALVPPLREALRRHRVPRAVADVLAMTAAATLATAPLLAIHFEEVSIVSPAANLIAAPAVPPLMWLGMVAMAIGQVLPALAEPLNSVNAPLLAYVEWVAAGAAAFPGAALPARLGGPAGLAAVYAAGIAAVYAIARAWRVHERRRPPGGAPARARHAVVAAAALCLAGLALTRLQASPGMTPPRAGELVVSFLDVGQGDATLLQLDGAAVLFDTGPPGGPILRRLTEAGVRRLDALVITHAQADHEGMALPVLQRLRPPLVVNGGAGWASAVQAALPRALRAIGAHAVAAHAGQALTLGPLRLKVLWPPEPAAGWRPEGDPNLHAMVVHVSLGSFDLLLPADAESDVTARLDLPRVEALKVAHHGSEDVGLPRLLNRLRPRFAAIEVGERNTYGHPAPSTLAALRAIPHVLRTDRDGTIRLRIAGDRIAIETA